jgi:hypothetical protein
VYNLKNVAFTVLQKRVVAGEFDKLRKENRFKNKVFDNELVKALEKDFGFNVNQSLVIIKAAYSNIASDSPELMSYLNSALDLALTINLVDTLKTN